MWKRAWISGTLESSERAIWCFWAATPKLPAARIAPTKIHPNRCPSSLIPVHSSSTRLFLTLSHLGLLITAKYRDDLDAEKWPVQIRRNREKVTSSPGGTCQYPTLLDAVSSRIIRAPKIGNPPLMHYTSAVYTKLISVGWAFFSGLLQVQYKATNPLYRAYTVRQANRFSTIFEAYHEVVHV